MKPLTAILVVGLIVVVVIGIVLEQVLGNDPDGPGPIAASDATPTPPPPANTIPISIASSTTKTEWLDAAVEAFNTASQSDSDLQVNGRPIEVEILKEKDAVSGRERHWNSGTMVKTTLSGDIKPTILSPATTFWISWLNSKWRPLNNGRDIASGPAPSLLTTPVVIAMWESRARALGCWPAPEPTCTWQRLRELASSPEGWGMVGHPEWGKFHFGYAYVGESDVGTHTVVLFCMIGLQKTADLQVADVASDNACGQAIADVEQAIVHRGTASPLILAAMRGGGPAFLDAVTTYEKNVIGFNRQNPQNSSGPGQMVAVYPQDGTVVADHPFAVVDNADWVTDQQVEAAKVFQDFLLSTEQQRKLVESGLRPIDPDIPLGPPIDSSNGANPAADVVKELQVPDVLVVDQVVAVWNDLKKPANIVLVFDKSGSMRGEKIEQARTGAIGFVGEMGRKDWLFWLPFDAQLYPGTQGEKGQVGEQLEEDIRSTTARGGTALYDAIASAKQDLDAPRGSLGDTARYGIVVLSDGKDTSSGTTLAMLEDMLRPKEGDQTVIEVHTIGIGDDAEDEVLTRIAKFSPGGRYWKVEDISALEAVYRLITKYF